MLHTIEDDIRLCKEFNLSAGQLFFLKMLIKDPTYEEDEWRRKSRQLREDYQKHLKHLSEDELSDLVARNIIIDDNDMGVTIFAFYEINPIYANKFELRVMPAMDLVDNYPGTFKGSDGKTYIGTNVSAQEIAKDYLLAINNNMEEHKRVLEDLRWAKKNNGIVLGLKKFVQTRYWRVIREARLNASNKSTDVRII